MMKAEAIGHLCRLSATNALELYQPIPTYLEWSLEVKFLIPWIPGDGLHRRCVLTRDDR